MKSEQGRVKSDGYTGPLTPAEKVEVARCKCGGQGCPQMYWAGPGIGYRWTCAKCGYKSEIMSTPELAIAEWNAAQEGRK